MADTAPDKVVMDANPKADPSLNQAANSLPYSEVFTSSPMPAHLRRKFFDGSELYLQNETANQWYWLCLSVGAVVVLTLSIMFYKHSVAKSACFPMFLMPTFSVIVMLFGGKWEFANRNFALAIAGTCGLTILLLTTTEINVLWSVPLPLLALISVLAAKR